MQRPKGLRFRRRIDDPGRIGAGAGGQDGMNGVHAVLNARFAVDAEPSFQGDLAVIAAPAAAYHDRIVVRPACQGHLEFVPRRVVVTDRRHGKAVARGQFDGQFAEPCSSQVLKLLLAAGRGDPRENIAAAHLARGSAGDAARVAQSGLAIVRETEFAMWLPKFEDIARGLLRCQRQPQVRTYLEEFAMTKRQVAPSPR